MRPFYYANNTVADRESITIQALTKKPKLIPLFAPTFLRDVLYALYPDEIFYEWEGERPQIASRGES